MSRDRAKKLATQARYRERHREKIRREAREYRLANLAADRYAKRKYHLSRSYNITPEAHAALLLKQGSVCAICKSPDPIDKQWNTDHCHKTGTVRGILCGNCNRGLGIFQDDPELLYVAMQYLKRVPEDI